MKTGIRKFITDFRKGIEEGVKVFVIMNERHSLLPEQFNILKGFCDSNNSGYAGLVIPANGFTKKEMDSFITEALHNSMNEVESSRYVFVTPVPYLIGRLASSGMSVYLFHNDNKVEREYNGSKIFSSAKTGWKLLAL